MLEWAVVKRHIAEEITLLCPQHHREKTYGWLSSEKVKESDANPFNKNNSYATTYNLHFEGDSAEVSIGSNTFICNNMNENSYLAPLIIDDLPMIEFTLIENQLFLNVIAFDIHGNTILEIIRNELTYSTSSWDIKMEGTTLKIREAQYKILLEIDFSPPNKITVNRGRFLRNGIEVNISPDNVLISNTNSKISGSYGENLNSGIIVGTKTIPRLAISEQPVPRPETQKKIPAANFSKKRRLSVMQIMLTKDRTPSVNTFKPDFYKNQIFENEEIPLDFSTFLNCRFNNCKLQIHGFAFPLLQGCKLDNTTLHWESEAGNTLRILDKLWQGDDWFSQEALRLIDTIFVKPTKARLM